MSQLRMLLILIIFYFQRQEILYQYYAYAFHGSSVSKVHLLFNATSLKVKREEHLVMLVSLINARH